MWRSLENVGFVCAYLRVKGGGWNQIKFWGVGVVPRAV